MLWLPSTDVFKRLAKKLLAFGDCYLGNWLMARICNRIDTWGWIFIVIITRSQTSHCRLLRYITPLKVKGGGHLLACCCKMLLHVNRWENRKNGNSVKILMSLYHVTGMLLHRCTRNELGRCRGWGREANKECGVSTEECREKLGGQRGGSCGTAGEGSKAGEVHLQPPRGRRFHWVAAWYPSNPSLLKCFCHCLSYL